MTEPTAKTPSGRGLKIALAVSLALNLAVAGLVAGAWLSDHGPRRDMPRDLSFGPFTEALSPQDRRALRREFLSRAPEFRAARQEARAEFDRLLAALRAEPFDPAALTSALAAIQTRNSDRLELGRSLIETRLLTMEEADRRAFADRLDAALRRRP
ncbi:MAG: periplasmic heavy metal sensor [Alphaproteobacteria bacterium]